ncbi:ice-binding family protein [Cellulomonas sp. S1-8]|uniref:ice-binding family protein n=1 Tax=Cellulomonas sp. S1-8 TaxID=2904790 RepID=UPI002242C89E|nr:ice-binding family protein [Cellulomonas sp. S1-8]UZN01808.1 ice-binding family protein [Cellulomonas sp. S1-8]
MTAAPARPRAGALPGRRRLAARAGRSGSRVVAVLLAFVVTATSASGYWSSTGSASASATTGTLSPPTGVTVPADVFTDVPLEWTPSAGAPTPEGYLVTRSDGVTTSPACGSTPTSLVVGTVCSDVGVPPGDHTYVVTAVYRSWTAPGTASGTVTVSGATRLVFGVQPTGTAPGADVAPAVTVRLATADGTPVATAGIAVTVAIADGPPGAVLGGTLTVATASDGTATFDGLTVDQVGTGYTLVASAVGLASGTSDPFDVAVPGPLGAAAGFSVLAGTAVVSTGATAVSGDLGVSPGIAVSGFPPGIVAGDVHAGDDEAADARTDMIAAYDQLAALAPDDDLSGDLNGVTLLPGVYRSGAALALTGTLILDALGDADAVFVIQVGAALDTAAASAVVLTGDAQASNVFWVVAGAMGTGGSSAFSGTVIAQGAITLGAGTVLIGRALSYDAVTLAGATIRFTTAPPPTISITGGDARATKDTMPVVSGTSDAPDGSVVTVTGVGAPRTTTVTGGTWSVTAAADLPAGTYAVVAKVRVASGDGGSDTQQLTVEVNPAPIALGSAVTFSVLAATGVVSTGATDLSGDLGVSPSASVTGFPPGVVHGTVHAGDAAAATAQADLLAALGDAASRPAHTQVSGNLGGRTFHVGVHHTAAALALTGTVVLDAEGDPDAVFVFRTDAALDTAAGSVVELRNGAQASNVFWVAAGAVGTGADSSFAGVILAHGAVTLGARSTLEGQALSRGTVTLADNGVTGVAGVPE